MLPTIHMSYRVRIFKGVHKDLVQSLCDRGVESLGQYKSNSFQSSHAYRNRASLLTFPWPVTLRYVSNDESFPNSFINIYLKPQTLCSSDTKYQEQLLSHLLDNGRPDWDLSLTNNRYHFHGFEHYETWEWDKAKFQYF